MRLMWTQHCWEPGTLIAQDTLFSALPKTRAPLSPIPLKMVNSFFPGLIVADSGKITQMQPLAELPGSSQGTWNLEHPPLLPLHLEKGRWSCLKAVLKLVQGSWVSQWELQPVEWATSHGWWISSTEGGPLRARFPFPSVKAGAGVSGEPWMLKSLSSLAFPVLHNPLCSCWRTQSITLLAWGCPS